MATLRSLGRYVDDSTYALARDLQAIVEQYPAASLVAAEQLEFLEDEPELPAGVSLLSVPGHSIDSRAVILRERPGKWQWPGMLCIIEIYGGRFLI